MRSRSEAQASLPRLRWSLLVPLVLALIALALTLRFNLDSSGGWLFLFSVFAPLLVLAASAFLGAVLLREYHSANRLFEVLRHPAGHTVFREGDPGDCVYFIRSGAVEIVREREGTVLARLEAGAYFGEMALLSDQPRIATVRTIRETELAALGKENFLELMSLMPATEKAILETVRERALRPTRSSARRGFAGP